MTWFSVHIKDHSENIIGGVEAFKGAPRFRHLSEGGDPDFANLPKGDTQILPNAIYQKN